MMSVTGPVQPAAIGRTMIHEHLAPRSVWPAPPTRHAFFVGQSLDTVAYELERLATAGVRTVVDVTPYGKGRQPELLRELSRRSGMTVVAATGFYKEPACPAFVHQAGVDELTAFLTMEIEQGLDGTDVRPGIIKVGTSREEITPTERKVFLAAAAAHRKTGLPITTHTTLGTMGREQADLLMAEGVEPARVVIGHCDLNRELSYHREILKTGVTIGFDTIGKERFHYRRHREAGYGRHAFVLEEHHHLDETRLRMLVTLLDEGFEDQIVLSSDLLWAESLMNQDTFARWGYSYLWEVFLPRLAEAGVSDDAIETMVVRNPARVLAGHDADMPAARST